jgi:hypothetical protein
MTEQQCPNRDDEQHEEQPLAEASASQPATASQPAKTSQPVTTSRRAATPQPVANVQQPGNTKKRRLEEEPHTTNGHKKQMIDEEFSTARVKRQRKNANQSLLQDAESLGFGETRVLRSTTRDKSKEKRDEQRMGQPASLNVATGREAVRKKAAKNVSQRRPLLSNPGMTAQNPIALTKPPAQTRHRRNNTVQQQLHGREPICASGDLERPVSSRLRSSGCVLLEGLP